MFIDIHTHVQQFIENDLDLLINNSINSKIEIIIAAGTTISDSKKTIELSKKYELIYSAVGIHPQNIFDENTNAASYIVKDPSSSKCAIIDSVLDFDVSAGAIKTEFADELVQKINDLEPLLELKALKQITLDEKLHGNALDRLMRDDGVDKLSEIGVDVRFVNR